MPFVRDGPGKGGEAWGGDSEEALDAPGRVKRTPYQSEEAEELLDHSEVGSLLRKVKEKIPRQLLRLLQRLVPLS